MHTPKVRVFSLLLGTPARFPRDAWKAFDTFMGHRCILNETPGWEHVYYHLSHRDRWEVLLLSGQYRLAADIQLAEFPAPLTTNPRTGKPMVDRDEVGLVRQTVEDAFTTAPEMPMTLAVAGFDTNPPRVIVF